MAGKTCGLVLGDDLAGDRVQGHQPLDLVAEELDAHRGLLVDREDLEGVPADAEGAAGEGHVVARVLDLDEATQDRVAVVLLADAQPQHPVDVLLRGAEAVDASTVLTTITSRRVARSGARCAAAARPPR